MTSPVVGTVAVEVLADVSSMAKSLRKEVESAFKNLDIGKLINDSVGQKTVKLPVDLDVDTESITEKVRRTRAPKVPVELDPVMAAFQAQVRSQVAALARESLKIPVSADTNRLRAELAAQLAAVQAQAKIQVPTEPGARGAYEARLKALLAEVSARVKQHVDVDVDRGGSGALGGLVSQAGTLSGALSQVATIAVSMGGAIAGAGTQSAGPIGAVISAMVTASAAVSGLAAAVAVLPSLFAAAAGAAAAIPGALTGAGAAIGTLALGFKGIGAAFKPKAASGGDGGGQDQAAKGRQIAAAERGIEAARRGIASATRGLAAAQRGLESSERGLADAQQAVVDAQHRAAAAQLAVNAARVQAREDIDDLGRALRGAQLDEEGAALAVTDALRELNAAKLTGNIPDIQRADLAYRQAQLTLENAKDTAQDLGQEQAKANKLGVDGSDKVVSALDAQTQAQKGVKDAQEGVLDAQNSVLAAQDGLKSANDALKSSYDGLKSAQDSLASANTKAAGGAAAVGAEVVKLAPAAQRFVDAIKALKPAFEDLRLDVQQRLFQGLDQTVTKLGEAWIPALKTTLGSYADTFNGFFKDLGKNISTPEFITNIQTGAEGARKGLEKVGTAITGPLVDAFGRLSAAAAPFLEQLGTEIGDVVTEFGKWITTADESGSLQEFFTTATTALHDIFTTGKLAIGIIGKIIGIIIGAKPSNGDSPLQSFNDYLQKVSDFLDDPQHQQQLSDFVTALEDASQKAFQIMQFVIRIDEAISDFITGVQNTAADLKAAFDKTVAFLQSVPDRIAGFFQSLPDRITGFINTVATRGGQAAGYAAGQIAGFFRDLPDRVGAFVSSIPDRIRLAIDNAILIVQGLPAKFDQALQGLAGIGDKIAGFFDGLYDRLHDIGVNVADGLVNGITDSIQRVKDVIGRFVQGVIDGFKRGFGIASPSTVMTTVGHNLIQGLINGIGNYFTAVTTRMNQLRTTIFNRLSDAGSFLYGKGQTLVYGLVNGIRSWFGNLSTQGRNLVITVRNSLANAGNELYNHGQNFVYGLLRGITSVGGYLYNSVVNFIRNNVVNPTRNFLGIHSPSRLAAELGARIPEGLALGIDGNAADVKAAAERMAALAVPNLADTNFGLAGDLGSVAGSLSKSVALELSWAPGASGDPVLDGLRSLIKGRYRGSVDAALSTA